jgi:hypothetical protein
MSAHQIIPPDRVINGLLDNEAYYMHDKLAAARSDSQKLPRAHISNVTDAVVACHCCNFTPHIIYFCFFFVDWQCAVIFLHHFK